MKNKKLIYKAMSTFTPAIDAVLWIALNWNDHNHDADTIRYHARRAATALGIPESDCGMNPTTEREVLFQLWNDALKAAKELE